jgi:hypothetical protein
MAQIEPFEFKTEVLLADWSVETITVVFKPYEWLPVGVPRLNRDSDADFMWAAFEWGLEPEQLALFDKAPVTKVRKMFEAWRAAAPDDDTDKDDDTDD